MDNNEQRYDATVLRTNDERADSRYLWKLGALLALVLFMAGVLTRQIIPLAESVGEPAPRRATTNFFKLQVGDFHAEIQWDSVGKQE